MWGPQSWPLPIPILGLLASHGHKPRKSNLPNSLSLPPSLLTPATHLAPNSMLNVTWGMPGWCSGHVFASRCLPAFHFPASPQRALWSRPP